MIPCTLYMCWNHWSYQGGFHWESLKPYLQVNAKMLNNIIEEEDDCFVFFYEEVDPEAHAILAELEGECENFPCYWQLIESYINEHMTSSNTHIYITCPEYQCMPWHKKCVRSVTHTNADALTFLADLWGIPLYDDIFESRTLLLIVSRIFLCSDTTRSIQVPASY